MQHRHDQALTLAERSVELQEEAGHAARPRRGAGVARADLRPPRQSDARGGGAQSRARRAQPAAVHARDDRRGVRHAGADSPDPRRVRRGEPLPAEGARGLRRQRHAGGALVSVVAARARRPPGAAPRRARAVGVARRRRSPALPEAPPRLRAAGRADRRRGAARVRADRERAAASRRRRGPHPARRHERHLGRAAAPARPPARRGRPRHRRVPRLRPERQRVRSARREAPGRPELSGTGPAVRGRRRRDRARPAISSDAVAIFESLGAAPDLAEAQAALAQAARPADASRDPSSRRDGDDAIVRRLVDAAVLPALLAREAATALLEAVPRRRRR